MNDSIAKKKIRFIIKSNSTTANRHMTSEHFVSLQGLKNIESQFSIDKMNISLAILLLHQ